MFFKGNFPVPPKFKEWHINEKDRNGIEIKPMLYGLAGDNVLA